MSNAQNGSAVSAIFYDVFNNSNLYFQALILILSFELLVISV